MLIWDILSSAFRSLAAHRLRTALTMLGVMIGVGAVVAMISLGEGAKRSVEKTIKSLGTNMLFIRPGSPQRGHVRSGSVETLMPSDAEALAGLAGVVAVAPERNRPAQVKYLAANANTGITGSTADYLAVRAFRVERGNFFSGADVLASRRVAVLGGEVAEKLFGGLEPVGERIQIKSASFQVVGVLEKKGDGGWMNPDDQILVPLTTHQRVLFGAEHLSSISVQVAEGHEMTTVQEDVERTLRARHRLREEQESDFNIRSQTEMLATMGEVTQTFTMLLGGVAAVSLLVGGIGIMNIMLVSVRERTREIGIRKAVGARQSDILIQFLVEAVVVSVLGGALGVALGFAIAQGMSGLFQWEPVVPFYAVVLSFLTSAFIGILFGVWPAREAARLDPVEALRYE